MATHTATAGTVSSSDFSTAAQFNDLPGGWIGYFARTSDVTGLATIGALTGLSGAVTVGTSRRIKLTAFARFNSDVATDDFSLTIQESSTDLCTTSICGQRTTVTYGGIATIILTPSAGSHTYTCIGGRVGGTGNVSMQASSTHPCFLLVEDIGPA